MENADEGDLSLKINQMLKKHLQFKENTIWTILIQILEFINYVYKNRIIHKYLKSANIFLTQKGIVKICDLNVSIIAKKKFSSNPNWYPILCCPRGMGKWII